jgi:hypothetical protein
LKPNNPHWTLVVGVGLFVVLIGEEVGAAIGLGLLAANGLVVVVVVVLVVVVGDGDGTMELE